MTERIYARVSTEHQSLDRQRESTYTYAQDNLNANIADVPFYSDKSTGTNTDRSDYQQLLNDIEEGDIVIVDSLSRLSRSLQDLQDSVKTITVDKGAELHFVDERLVFEDDSDDPFQTLQLQLLGAFAEFEASIRQQRAREGLQARMNADEEYKHGRAPIGFRKEDGRIYKADNFDEVRATLQLVDEDELSQRKAAERLDCTRKTVRNALQKRRELYEL